jgi:hypothetical protein
MAFAQEEIAAAEPEAWSDAIVDDVTPGGWISLKSVDGESHFLAWNHCDLVGTVSVGDPVAVNSVRHVLSAGGHSFNILLF